MLTGSNVSKLSATRGRTRAFHLLFAASIVAQLILISAFRFHPCWDVPNHLASLKILSALRSGDPFFSTDFTYAIRPVPYTGLTLLWLGLPDGLDLHTFEKLVLGLYVVCLPLAHYYLLRVLCPENLELSLLSSIVTINWAYDFGNLNFLICMPVALMACAVFHKSWASWWALILFFPVAAIVYACHVYGLVCLMVFCFCLVISTSLRGLSKGVTNAVHTGDGKAGIGRWCLGCGWLLMLFAMAYLLVYPESGTPKYAISFRELYAYFDSLFRFRGGLRLAMPMLLATMMVSPIVDLSRGGFRKLRASIVWPLALPGFILFLMYMLGPETIGQRTSVSSRFLLPSFLLACCSYRLIERPGYRFVLLAVLTVVFAAKWTADFSLHSRYNRDGLAIEEEIIQRLPTNSRVLTTHWIQEDEDGYRSIFFFFYHYAIVDRQVYMPNLFSSSFNTVQYKTIPIPPFRRPISVDDLEGYEYVWVLSDIPEQVTGGIKDDLTPISQTGVQHLYRINASDGRPEGMR